ncbi:Ima1 N-terminal domain-domain-containing protein [Clohesyomyces aquaticus]|uniref:Ima1 N-terminal domain-domain-containing protein n=1 Tax=Clohesyomyces aquaticus TaxID=1231657 RepID=A0A1Y1ZR38_9PLEO|nr:Ima1 N-terminal domain-domain-containing protein [Clohesyomyces aquaticus]
MGRRLLGRGLTCHYCNTYSRDNAAGITRAWLCTNCESMNYLDERGQITDPPAAETAPGFVRYAQSQSPEPTIPTTTKNPFCDACQRNQSLANQLLAEYLPDEDDPEYSKYEASVDKYRDEVERRYPPVCDKCVDNVQKQIRAAQYAANTDHLRRMLEFSRRHRAEHDTHRQRLLLRLISFAKWTYRGSIFLGLVWHAFGVLLSPNTEACERRWFNWDVCLSQAVSIRAVERACFDSPPVMQLVKYALVADLLTFWWNPQLKAKISKPGGRMRGLTSQWLLRLAVVALRFGFVYWCQQLDLLSDDLQIFRISHGAMLAVIVISTLFSRRLVYIDYQSTKSFMKKIDPYLPQAATSCESTAEPYLPARPNHDSFDTMAQSFTQSFPTNNLDEVFSLQNDSTSNYPPSPTESIASLKTTRDDESEVFTPYQRRPHRQLSDAMDWTPTRRTFAPPQEVLPPIFKSPSSTTTSTTTQPAPAGPHSIFSQPSSNPFDRRVPPPPPKHKEHERRNPWKSSSIPIQTEISTAKKGLFQGSGSPASQDALRQPPSRVKRDEELFKPPQLKYDTYTKPKMTGLEDTFNSMFSG